MESITEIERQFIAEEARGEFDLKILAWPPEGKAPLNPQQNLLSGIKFHSERKGGPITLIRSEDVGNGR